MLLFIYHYVTVYFVLSNVAKIYSRLPAAMEFWLVCLGILAYSCQNTSRDSGVWTVTPDYHLLFTHYCPAKQLFGYEQIAKRIANIRLTFHLQFLTDTWQYKNRNVQCEFTQFYKYTVFFRNCYKLYGWFLTFSHTWRHFASTNFVQKIFIKKFSFGSFHL